MVDLAARSGFDDSQCRVCFSAPTHHFVVVFAQHLDPFGFVWTTIELSVCQSFKLKCSAHSLPPLLHTVKRVDCSYGQSSLGSFLFPTDGTAILIPFANPPRESRGVSLSWDNETQASPAVVPMTIGRIPTDINAVVSTPTLFPPCTRTSSTQRCRYRRTSD